MKLKESIQGSLPLFNKSLTSPEEGLLNHVLAHFGGLACLRVRVFGALVWLRFYPIISFICVLLINKNCGLAIKKQLHIIYAN